MGASAQCGIGGEVCARNVVDDVEAAATGGVAGRVLVVDGDGDGEDCKGGGERIWGEVDGVKVVHSLEDADHLGVEGVVGGGGVEGGGVVGEEGDRVEAENVEVEKTMGVEVKQEAAGGIEDGAFLEEGEELGVCFLDEG